MTAPHLTPYDGPEPHPTASPDCRDGKHRACIGVGFDDALDDVCACPCTCHTEE